jgi:hypothetical protein
MAKNDQQESYERLLSASNGRMMELVRFAETKNAALLTFCSIWMGTIIATLRSQVELPMGYRAAFMIILPLLSVAALLSLTSFLPKFIHVQRPTNETPNLLYFRDIANIGVAKFVDAAKERYFPPDDESATKEYLNDLAGQVAVQAIIANQKFKTFNMAGRLVLSAFVCMAAPPVIWVLQTLWNAVRNWAHSAN